MLATAKAEILIVGGGSDIATYFDHRLYEVTVAGTYKEACELLSKHLYDSVFTNAELPDKKSGLDILRMIQGINTVNTTTKAVVCHPDKTCEAEGRTWMIIPSVTANFSKFASFHQGTIAEYCSFLAIKRKKCA